MHNINLDDIRLFVAVVQAGSLSRASELTGVPTSRLSRRLTELESSLGTQLINRGKKGVSLNELGERFFIHAQEMLSHASLAIDSIHHGLDKPTGLLKLSVPADISALLLAPNLPKFLALYPDVSLDISLTQTKINMIQDGIDIAIRAGNIDNDNVVAKVVMTMDFAIFTSTKYLQNHPKPTTPNDLYQHAVIAQTLSLPWTLTKPEHTVKLSPQPFIGCNDFALTKDLIKSGLGVGLLPTFMADDELVGVLDDWQIPSVPLSAIYYKNRGASPAIRSFVAWLGDVLQNSMKSV